MDKIMKRKEPDYPPCFSEELKAWRIKEMKRIAIHHAFGVLRLLLKDCPNGKLSLKERKLLTKTRHQLVELL